MTALVRRLAFVILISFIATPVLAQTRVPDRNMGAIGLWGGVAMPSDEVLDNGWFMGVTGEGYLTPRFSIRGQIAGAWFDVNGGGLDGKVSPMQITGNGVYNFERGKWHPYATAGIGWYRYRFGEGDDRATDSKVGANLGGGVEYFFTRRDTIAGEITFHIIPDFAESPIFDYKSKYWTLAAGYKRYF